MSRLLLVALVLAAPVAAHAREMRIVGYVSRRTDIARIDPMKVTHLNYAFAKIQGNDLVAFEESNAAKNLTLLHDLQRINPKLKIILSIGGWGAGWFSDAALTPVSRCRFATSAVMLMDQYNLDGIDVDWEYPGQKGGGAPNGFRAEDKENFTKLLAEVRNELDVLSDARGRKGSDRYTLTIASSGDKYLDHVELSKLHPLVDWFNLMTYDFVGYTRATGHASGLHGTGTKSIDASAEQYVRQYLAAGVPASKIVLGVPFYGRIWAWVNRKSDTGIDQPFDSFHGDVPWSELQRTFLNDPRYVHGWDRAAGEPYLWDRELGTFLSYDDPRSMTEKANFIKRLKLGGVMYWEHTDDPDETLLTVLANTLR
jgi:chitinase